VTDIEICNMALGFCGKDGIAAFEDDSTEARACKAFYAGIRDKVLEDRIWSFAKEQYILAPVAGAPLFGFTKKFQLPGEVVRVHRADDGSGDYRMIWDLPGRHILTDAEQVFITAVKKIEDTSLFSPGFSLAVALRLAYTLAVPMTENRQLKADLWAEYQTEIKDAGGVDGSQGKSERVRSDGLARRR
jgi:hypothetical protein